MTDKVQRPFDIPLPCGCTFTVNSSFVSGQRLHECEHQRWMVNASRSRDTVYTMTALKDNNDG